MADGGIIVDVATKAKTPEEPADAPCMSKATRALLDAAVACAVACDLGQRDEAAIRRAHRIEAEWLHAWRTERGIDDPEGAKAVAGSPRAVWAYLQAPRGPREAFGVAPLLPPKGEKQHHVELSDALRRPQVTYHLHAARSFLVQAFAGDDSRWFWAAHNLEAALVRAGVEPDGSPDAVEARTERVAAALRKLKAPPPEDSVLARIALTSVLGWSVSKAKAAVRALDRPGRQ
jgi:hypothetical protein